MRKINLLDLVRKSLLALTAFAVGFGVSAQAISVDSLKSGFTTKTVQACDHDKHGHDGHHNHDHDHDEHHNHDHDHDDHGHDGHHGH